MVCLNFTVPGLKDKILDGTKSQTIRKYKPERIRQMERLGIQVYWHQRQEDSIKLFDASLDNAIRIRFYGDLDSPILAEKLANWHYFNPTTHRKELDAIAQRDGFDSFQELIECLYGMYGDDLFLEDYVILKFSRLEEEEPDDRGEIRD